MTDGQRNRKTKNAEAHEASAPPAPAREARTAAAKTAASGASLAKLHADAYRQYLRAFQDIWEETRRGGQEASRKYWADLQEAQLATQQAVHDANRTHVKAVQEIGDDADRHKRSLEAHRSYQLAVHQVSIDSQRGWDAAATDYQDTVSASRSTFQKRCEEAYREYLKTVRNAWAKVDLDAVDPGSLAQVASSLGGAAHHVASTLGRS